MIRQWSPALVAVLISGAVGCARLAHRPDRGKFDEGVGSASYHPEVTPRPAEPMATAEMIPIPPELSGPQPVDAYIRRALAENRTVQAAFHNVQSLKHRIPQVTALDDPVASNTIFPIPSVAPQYSLMGYNPYNLTLAQQFPWCGTLRVRGQVAARDVDVALAEMAAAQLDAVMAVKRAYYDLYANQKTEAILGENRKILETFRERAAQRLEAGGTQQDLLRAGVLISELDRELANTEAGIATARAALARQLHVSPEADLRALPDAPPANVPAQIERLYQLAIAARPELKGRLSAIARDEQAVELARKRAYPNVTLGLTYMDMEKTNAVTPKTASGFPNVGLFVGFNLPFNRAKYRAGVGEAQERTLADARLYEAQRDETYSEIHDFMTQARVQQNVLGLLRDSILPRAEQALELAGKDFAAGNVDLPTVLSAQRETLQVQVQVAQVEGELGKALASLERAVGCQLNQHPIAPATADAVSPAAAPLPPPSSNSGPFERGKPSAVPAASEGGPLERP
jgi:cobalt-zinc-cadmium efflux system outer membrane protein